MAPTDPLSCPNPPRKPRRANPADRNSEYLRIVSWPFFFVQATALGLCVLLYPNATLPRWVGYLSIWFGLSMFPASLIVFFYQGPVAWNGVFALYLPLAMFAVWFNVVAFHLRRGIKARALISEPDAVTDRAVTAPA